MIGQARGHTPSMEQAGLLVTGRRTRGGKLWVRVLLPERPNGRQGWIALRDGIELRTITARLVVNTDTRTLTLFDHGKAVLSSPVIVGAWATPTPRGRFALWDRTRMPSSSPLHPWILALTAHSEVLRNYDGGEGRVALHGAHGSLAGEFGAALSHGCIRTPDAVLRRLARLPLGTPIRVVGSH